jgi:hypothetical protein
MTILFTKRGRVLAAISFIVLLSVFRASAQNGSTYFYPGNLVVSRSVYDNNPDNIQVGTILPPNCTTGCATEWQTGLTPSYGTTIRPIPVSASPLRSF